MTALDGFLFSVALVAGLGVGAAIVAFLLMLVLRYFDGRP